MVQIYLFYREQLEKIQNQLDSNDDNDLVHKLDELELADRKEKLKQNNEIDYIDEKFEDAFLGQPRQLVGSGRSGGMFRIRVEDQDYVMKICNLLSESVLNEMINEVRVYEHLNKHNFQFALEMKGFGLFRRKNYMAIALLKKPHHVFIFLLAQGLISHEITALGRLFLMALAKSSKSARI